jgi:acyl-CoA reductase-like NAD-dependent aldehyde dehydrogenase
LENVDSGNVLYATEVFGPVAIFRRVSGPREAIRLINERIGIVACIDTRNKDVSEHFIQSVLRTRVDDGRHGTGAFWATRFGGDRGAGSGNPALDENMVYGYVLWKTIYRSYTPLPEE